MADSEPSVRRGQAAKPGHKQFARDIRFIRAHEGLNLGTDSPSARLLSSLPTRYGTGGLLARSGHSRCSIIGR